MEFQMAKDPTTIEKIKKLREEEANLVETAKAEALAKTNEGIDELIALGFQYELVEPSFPTTKAARKARGTGKVDHTPKGTCPLCQFATTPPHDKRSHRSQVEKKPFTDAELKTLNMVKAAAEATGAGETKGSTFM